MSDQKIDDLELELRRLPGVRSAGFDERDDLLLVQLHVTSEGRNPGLPAQATRVAARHSDRPVAVEVVRWHKPAPAPETGAAAPDEIELRERATGEIVLTGDEAAATAGDAGTADEPVAAAGSVPARARLLAVLSFPDSDEVEVHLVLAGRRTIGRAHAGGGLPAVIDATIDALGGLGATTASTTLWARPLEGAAEGSSLVAAALQGGDSVCYGLAAGSTPFEAAARAALHALNRRMEAVL